MESETKRISWEQQQAYLKNARDPRVYGLSIYDTPAGPQVRGGGRLHPERAEALELLATDPARPLVLLDGNSGEQWNVLLDFTSSATWLEFELARELGARPISEGKPQLVVRKGDEIPACFSTVSSLRLGQMFIEHPLVYVRMATGSLGELNRNVSEEAVPAVIGWDLLEKFDQIQLMYSFNQLVLMTTTEAYEPNPERLVAALPLLKYPGACMVSGKLNGQSGPVLIDPAGDFEVAVGSGEAVSSLKLGPDLVFSGLQVSESPGGVRVGARLLQNYRVVICPQAGMIYFETPPVFEQ